MIDAIDDKNIKNPIKKIESKILLDLKPSLKNGKTCSKKV